MYSRLLNSIKLRHLHLREIVSYVALTLVEGSKNEQNKIHSTKAKSTLQSTVSIQCLNLMALR